VHPCASHPATTVPPEMPPVQLYASQSSTDPPDIEIPTLVQFNALHRRITPNTPALPESSMPRIDVFPAPSKDRLSM
jgi:hypothetical protein